MANGNARLALSASRDIPFNKLVLSQSNVRRHGTIASNRPEKTGVSIEELAEDIFRRTLLQSLSVRAIVNDEVRGNRETFQAVLGEQRPFLFAIIGLGERAVHFKMVAPAGEFHAVVAHGFDFGREFGE